MQANIAQAANQVDYQHEQLKTYADNAERLRKEYDELQVTQSSRLTSAGVS